MRAFTSLSLATLCALHLSSTTTTTTSAREMLVDGYAHTEQLSVPLPDLHSHPVPRPRIPKPFLLEKSPAEEEVFDDERRQRRDDADSVVRLETDGQSLTPGSRADPRFRSADADPAPAPAPDVDTDADAPDTSTPGDEQDFSSNPTPISEGRRRAGILGILGTISLTTALGYAAYTRRERVWDVASSVAQRLPSLERLKYNNISSSLPSLSLPTLSMPTLSLSGAPRRTRKHRRLRRNKGGFRPPRNRGWTDVENGLLYDYDYDGDYERSHHPRGSLSPSSSSEDSYGAEAFDLGADEDFMIGAGAGAGAQRRRSPSASISSPATPKLGRGFGMGMDKVWGRWKRSSVAGRSGRKGRRSTSGSVLGGGANGGTVLFAVGNGEDVDLEEEEEDVDLETNEALPLAPTPHRFGQGLGGLKGYGSAG